MAEVDASATTVLEGGFMAEVDASATTVLEGGFF